MPVLYGVFLYMGVASLNGVQVRFSIGLSKLRVSQRRMVLDL